MNNFYPYKNPIHSKVPEEIFYKTTKYLKDGGTMQHYTAFNPQGEIIGRMYGAMETIFPLGSKPFFSDFKPTDSFYIYYIESHKHNFGNRMLDLIQIESKRQGGGGKFHLIASDRFNKQKPAHIFYRKYGMDSLQTSLIKRIDKYLKGKISLEDLKLCDIWMFFNPQNPKIPQKTSLIKKIMNIFKR